MPPANHGAQRARGIGGAWAANFSVVLWRSLLVTMLLLLMPLRVVASDKSTYEENLVKGAFLTKFALFVDWPASVFADAKTPVTIGIIGDDPFGPQFEAALSKEVANGRSFRLVRFKEPSEIGGCQILFVSGSASSSLREILKAVGQRPILVVGDQERFAHRGGMVNFVKEGGKLRFEVNTAVVESHGLKMSSKLLQVAKTVKTESEKGGS